MDGSDFLDIVTDLAIDKAICAFTKAHNELRDVIRQHPNVLPPGTITCGLFAEYYTRMYLDWKYDGAVIEYGRANERGWDLLLTIVGSTPTRYQVKAVSVYNDRRMVSAVGSDCDKLIVICLDGDFYPVRAYVFEDLRKH